MKIKIDIDLKKFKVNRIIKYFIIADLMFLGGWGLISPIFAIFVIERIPGATVVTVGVAAAIYWLVKSLLQLPVAAYLDRIEGEKDDFYALIIGLILAGFAAITFPLAGSVAALFLVVLIQAFAFGLYVPAWSAMFSRHLDKEHYAFDWSLDSTTMGLATGVSALLSGVIVKFFGFTFVFILASVLAFAAAITLFTVPNLILPKTKPSSKEVFIKDHSPIVIDK